MQCLRNLSAEFVSLNRLSIPAIIANAVDASFNITTIIILGHLGKGHLSAGVIALAMYNICWIFLEGMLTAQDNLVSKAFALKDRKLARYWSYIAGGVTFASLIPTTVLFVFGAVIVQYAFFIRPHTASKAAFFLILLLPGYCCHAMYRVLQKYLQCQRQLKMSLVCGLLGITTNIICKKFMFFVLLNIFTDCSSACLGGYVLSFTMGFGFSGCGIAVTTARAAMLLAMSSSVLKVVDMSR